MKIALLGDVHANLPALEAVLDHASQQGVQGIWNIGDFVGYGAFPNQVIERLRGGQALNIIGNYDLKVLRFSKKKEKWRKRKRPEKYLAFKWAHDNLSEENREYLASLPKERMVEIEGKQILLTHASPASNEEHLTPDTPAERFSELAHLAETKTGVNLDAIIFGHSHQAFAYYVEDVWFINTGSVGRPDDGDPRACYAVMQIDGDQIRVQHYRLAYDVGKAVAEIREKHLPEAFAQMMIQGVDLEAVLTNPS
jgi:putative phosphoesterase